MATHVFGLTGGIASGKSTVAARLRARGVPVIDADQLAREVVEPGTEGFRAIVDAFGTGVVGPSGHLDRKSLARIVFTDDERRKKLNAITHPLITQLFAKRVVEHSERGEPLVCWEAALLVENGVHEMFRPLVVVAAPEELQLARIRSRDGSAQEDALGRIRAQKPLAEKIAVADFVIETTGTLEQNARRTDEVLLKICERFGVDPLRYPA
jgi:dephospho-CoA kinase